jgi:hypothetical protein
MPDRDPVVIICPDLSAIAVYPCEGEVRDIMAWRGFS